MRCPPIALTPRTQANLLILLATLIWGSAFVAQRASMAHATPWLFTGARFLLGALVVTLVMTVRRPAQPNGHARTAHPWSNPALWRAALILGTLLAGAIGSQQIGLKTTTVANAGFISSLYVVLVPLLGLFAGHRPTRAVLLGAVLAIAGLYALSGPLGAWRTGDLWQLLGVTIVTFQIVAMGRFAPRFDPMGLASAQFLVCGVEGLLVSWWLEPATLGTALASLHAVLVPLLYGGVMSVGVAYTIQVVAQRHAKASDAALLFSLEGVFAALSGWLLLGESLTPRGLLGCALVFAGLVVSQRSASTPVDGNRPKAATVPPTVMPTPTIPPETAIAGTGTQLPTV